MALSKIISDSLHTTAVIGALSDNTVSSSKLTTTGVVANTYGDANNTPVVTVDAQGRVSSVTLANTLTTHATTYSNAVSYTDAKVANLVNSAPAALDTLLELANALGNDASFSTTVTTGIGNAYTNATAFAANATNITSGTLATARLPATANVSTSINVGANVNLTVANVSVLGTASRYSELLGNTIRTRLSATEGGWNSLIGFANNGGTFLGGILGNGTSQDITDVRLGTSTSPNTIVVSANGSVGIGTSDIFSPVVIKSDWRSGYGQVSLQSNTSGGSRGISLHNSDGTRTAYVSQDASTNNLSVGVSVATGKLFLITNDSTRVTVDAGGNTAIGTSNTSGYGFNVTKYARFNGLTLGNNDGSTASDDRFIFGWSSGTEAIIYAKQDVPFRLGTSNAYAMQVRTTSQGGRVDIGDYLQLQSTTASSGGSGPYELFRVGSNGLCTGGFFSVSATRGSFVHTTMWAWSSTHNSSGQGTLTQLSAGNYSNITMYIDVDSGGNAIISADWGASQSCSVSAIKFEGSGIDFSYRNTYWSSPASGYTRYSRGTVTLGFRSYNCYVDGTLSKASGTFRIDHPLESLSNTHQLVHSFIEGPKADLIYRGKATLVNGTATVNIDSAARMTEGTFEALCRDVQCFVTNDTDWSQVKGSVQGNILTITCQDNTSCSVVNWMVIGERKDKHMLESEYTDSEGRFIIEPLKNSNEGFQGEGEDLT